MDNPHYNSQPSYIAENLVMMKIRIGFGYDVHRFETGREMWLGGVEIPFSKGLKGHSDADALLHAICDSLLGAAGLRDIGYHFPDTDPAFKGIDSKILLANTWNLVKKQGWSISNLDCTVVAENPKINPFIAQMKSVISEILHTDVSTIGIKATTKEGLGAIGREEGLEAYAVVLIFSES